MRLFSFRGLVNKREIKQARQKAIKFLEGQKLMNLNFCKNSFMDEEKIMEYHYTFKELDDYILQEIKQHKNIYSVRDKNNNSWLGYAYVTRRAKNGSKRLENSR